MAQGNEESESRQRREALRAGLNKEVGVEDGSLADCSSGRVEEDLGRHIDTVDRYVVDILLYSILLLLWDDPRMIGSGVQSECAAQYSVQCCLCLRRSIMPLPARQRGVWTHGNQLISWLRSTRLEEMIS